ncbi:MAG: MFS transporter [Paraburkholderia sp.]|uniref:MFS transporter n=1 Tax=Paraburkholderia sp. TaxID=1926495 RepID=UPI003C3FBE1C
MTEREPEDRLARPRATNALVAAIFGSGMAFVDGTVVNVATATLQTNFSATVSQVQWVVEAYALTLSSLLLLGGRLGDLYGRRRVFIWGNVLFAASSLLCAICGSLIELVLARGVQGVAAALLIPGSLTIITSAYPASERARAIGIWSGSTAMMGAIGPFLGGWLIDHLSWRVAFFMSLPMAAVAALFASRLAESKLIADRRAPNWTSSVSMVAAFGTLTYALLSAQAEPGRAIPAVVASIVFFVALAMFERRAATPLFPTSLLKSPVFVGVNVITLFLYAALSGAIYFLPLNLIQVHHYAASEAGAALAPMILTLFVLSYWAGGLLGRYGARRSLTVGCCIVSVGFLGLCVPGTAGSYWETFFVPMLILGFGMSICVSPLTTTVMNSAPDDQLGAASGINNAVSRVAGLLSVAVFGLLLSVSFNIQLDSSLRSMQLSRGEQAEVERQRPLLAAAHYARPSIQQATDASFVGSFRVLMACSAGLALVSAACAWSMLKAERSR